MLPEGGIRRWSVDDQSIRAALERHWSDINDQDMVHEIYHDDAVLEFPQGLERLVGLANIRAMWRSSTSTMTIQRIRGTGDLWVAENIITYDGKPMHTVNIMEFRDGKVIPRDDLFGRPMAGPDLARSVGRALRAGKRAGWPWGCQHAVGQEPSVTMLQLNPCH